MEILFILLVLIGFGVLLYENHQYRKTIQTKDKAYSDLRKAYKLNESESQIIDN